ncbi:MAG: EF-hand domain-containing protein [Sphingomonadales bacterium]|nr:EF-hand domain-containing protein [Sphingomonadales bacterium]MDE2568323.1 EF-hand domain-containing protein [Sphingomonadales bacterium]
MGRLPLAIAGAFLMLAGCHNVETGPDDADTAAAAPVVATPLPAIVSDPAAAKPLTSFDGKDANGDGKITQAEYAKAAQSIFQMMDADQSGTVTVQEMDAARAALGMSNAEESSEKIIQQADSDGDGKLTLAEWMANANAQFDVLDTNKDGVIDRQEWDAAHPAPSAPDASASPEEAASASARPATHR